MLNKVSAPTISVVVPVYNSELYLARCVDSILNQGYKMMEIILVDDGSSDKSGKICDDYAACHKCIKVVHKKNGGLGSARVAGLNMAIGKYISFVDSDDWIEPFMYMSLINSIGNEVEPDIIVGGYVLEKSGTISCPFSREATCVLNRNEALLSMFENKRFNWSLCDKLYNRSLFNNANIIENWPRGYGEDTYANWRLFSVAKKVKYVGLYAYHYVMHEDSMTHQAVNKEKFDYFVIYKDIINEMSHGDCMLLLKRVIIVALSAGIQIINAAQENYECYEREIENGIKTLLSFVRIADDRKIEIDNKMLLRKFEAINRPRIEIESKIELRNNVLKKFCASQNVFLYGAGVVAEEIFGILKKLKIEIEKVIVSNKAEKNNFLGLQIISFSEFIDSNSHGVVLLAMNRDNTQDVLKKTGINKCYKVMDAGAFSLDY